MSEVLTEEEINEIINNLNYPLLIKDNQFLEFSEESFHELNLLKEEEIHLIKQAKMGKNNTWENTTFRGLFIH